MISRSAVIALALAAATVATGVLYGTWVAGGMDSYGYVSQSDRWLSGELTRPEPAAAAVPWPEAVATLTPIGYLAGPDGQSTVPYYAPGLSILMAGAQLVAGHCAVFWVVPLSGGLLVLTTYGLGRRCRSAFTGVVAAALVATSPTVLFMLTAPMSDVPAAAFWSLALYLVAAGPARLRPWAIGFAAGLSASVAITIRSNLVPIAGVIGAWLLWRDLVAARPRRWATVVGFVVGVLPGCLLIAVVNNAWYGSPLKTGPGSLDYLFSLTNVRDNLGRYPRWFVETETPVAAIGALTLLLPLRKLWSGVDATRVAALFAAIAAVALAIHALFAPLEEWWYLRYLLAAWPTLFVGLAVVIGVWWDTRNWTRFGALIVVAWLCLARVGIARERGAFDNAAPERRYPAAAAMVAESTDRASVILSMQHSGTVRYYGGRYSIRYDWLDPAWLDRAVDWLVAQGHHPYILLEEWERPNFRERFSAASRLGSLEMRTVFVYRNPAGPAVYLYDPLAPAYERPPHTVTEVAPPVVCRPPEPAPEFKIR